jgi:hypothetical protein
VIGDWQNNRVAAIKGGRVEGVLKIGAIRIRVAGVGAEKHRAGRRSRLRARSTEGKLRRDEQKQY